MSDYTKSTNFATKDNLTPGDPLKIVRGTEIDTEFNNIATAIATKTDNSAAAITGGSITGITDLAIADGGTGASTATAAINNLLPSQTSNANKYLQTDGTNVSWDAVSLSTSDITGTLPVANGGTGVTSSTGTGSVVLSNSPTLVTPALGTPASGVATNLTGLPLTTGVTGTLPIANGGTGQTTANAAFNALAPSQATASGKYLKSDGTNTSWDALDISTADITGTLPVANGGTGVTTSTGTGNVVLSSSPTLVTPALGTPSSATLTNATGLPIATGVSGLGTGVATFLATPSSANLRSALTDETGTGSAVFATSPTLVTPVLGTPTSATLTNATGLPLTTGVTGTLPTANGGTNLTSFTSGGVVYASSSSALATGSALTFDGSKLTLLSGTSTGATFASNHVIRTDGTNGASFSAGVPSTGSVTSGYYFSSPTAAYEGGVDYEGTNRFMTFRVANTEGLRLTSSSLYTASGINVGIGNSNPQYPLDVSKAGGGNFVAYFKNTTNTTPYTVRIQEAASAANGYPLFDVVNSAGTNAHFLVHSGTGNVGIGTSSPTDSSSFTKAVDAQGASGAAYYARATSGGGYVAFGQYNTGGGTAYIINSGTGPLLFDLNGVVRAKINNFGIGVGTATPSSGTGITFPATQSASSDANTLDDYEEGDWTPNLTRDGSAPLLTGSTFNGTYTKVGRVVTCVMQMSLTVITQGSGNWYISNLPFTVGTLRASGVVGNSSGFAATGCYVIDSSTQAYFTNAGALVAGNNTGGTLYASITYFV